jgi:hypothetical protein
VPGAGAGGVGDSEWARRDVSTLYKVDTARDGGALLLAGLGGDAARAAAALCAALRDVAPEAADKVLPPSTRARLLARGVGRSLLRGRVASAAWPRAETWHG